MRRTKAFTLAEILTVVMIIGLIAAIAVPQVSRAARQGRDNALRANLSAVRAAVSSCYQDTGAYPAQLADLAQPTAPSSGVSSSGASRSITASDWRGPYLPSVPTDPVSGAALSYSNGVVSSSASGTDLSGSPYSGY